MPAVCSVAFPERFSTTLSMSARLISGGRFRRCIACLGKFVDLARSWTDYGDLTESPAMTVQMRRWLLGEAQRFDIATTGMPQEGRAS